MRPVLIALLLAGCFPMYEDDIAVSPDASRPPDAALSCEIGAFEIAAPRQGLTYTPSMDVVIDEAELQGALTFQMVDELNNQYQYTSQSYMPNPGDAGWWWSRDTFHYELAAQHVYTLTVSHCQHVQRVGFFTSQ